jgi:hypothetical protein
MSISLWVHPAHCLPGVLYIAGQTLGAAVAGGLLAGTWGYERSVQSVLSIHVAPKC